MSPEKYMTWICAVGVVPVSEITKHGKKFNVAKYIFTPTGCCIAMFQGGGANLADYMVKHEGYEIQIEEGDERAPNLDGLSCRWQPIKAEHDTIMTLLVLSTIPESDTEIYDEINRYISGVLDQDVNPVNIKNLKYKWPTFETLRQCRMVWQRGNVPLNIADHVFWIVLFNVLNRLNPGWKFFNVPHYRQSMIDNSDYKKFDDTLRMVVDCTTEQTEKN